MRHEKTVSVSKIKPLWEPWEEDETPRKFIPGAPSKVRKVRPRSYLDFAKKNMQTPSHFCRAMVVLPSLNYRRFLAAPLYSTSK